jgi:hypothetical protein
MPLLDLSLVTKSLTTVIEQVLKASPEATKYTPLTVSSLPPNKLTGDHTVGLYLYHAEEHPSFKNAPPAGGDVPPVRFTELGLNLYYQLTAHSDILETSAEMEQLLMGLAMKALHDYASIDDQTKVGAVTVFPSELIGRGNIFRVVLLPLLAHEAPNYWTAGSQPLRFAAYYQASVAFMEAEKPVIQPSRVLTYSVAAFSRATAYLETSQSTVTFTYPGELTPRSVDVRPAQTPVTGRLTFSGSGLAGDATTLLIRNRRFAGPVEVGSEWGVSATDSTITAVVQAMADGLVVLPGVYSAAAKIVLNRLGPNNMPKAFGFTSNEAPFLVTPRIDAIATVGAVVTVSGGIFQDPAIGDGDVQVLLGTTAVQPKAGIALNPGEFETPNPSTLRLRWPAAGFQTGDRVSLRIIVNGAESAPVWVTAP